MIPADWFIPDGIHLAFTDRLGGVSQAPYASLNLGDHVGDEPTVVQQNRALLVQQLALPSAPLWLTQVHGIEVMDADVACKVDVINNVTAPQADGSFSQQAGRVLSVMTADCLPVLMCDAAGKQLAALHAGWRGLCHGILEAGIAKFTNISADNPLYAYLGPAIGPQAFEVGAEVRDAFLQTTTNAAQCFTAQANIDAQPNSNGQKYLADLQQLARLRLRQAGVQHIYALPHCTYSQPDKYFSYRRESVTGRMASLIWRTA